MVLPAHSKLVPWRSHITAPAVLLTLLLVNCAGTPPANISRNSFSGPWAEEFAYFDENAATDFAHSAFADSIISDLELQEGLALVRECFASHGATVEYDIYGNESVTVNSGSEDPLDVMGTCAAADGGVVILYHLIRLNPDNLDDFTIQAACLVDAGIVEPGFTAQDLEQAYDSEVLPWAPGDETAATCMLDPLGLSTTDAS